MNLVAAAVGGVVPKLTKLLEDEFKLQRELKMRIQSLSNELNYIHAFLCKVSEVPWEHLDEQVKVWASDIREASYDMEDILDTFLVRVDGREPTGQNRLKRAMKKITDVFSKAKARHDVGSAIQDIMKRLQEVADLRARYKIDDLLVNFSAITSSFDPRLKAMYNEVASLVGMDGPSKEIISKLSSGQRDDMTGQKKTISIVGTGGLGKTTLAKAVYDKLRSDFKCYAFVPVGRNPNLEKVLTDILYELDKNKLAEIDAKNRNQRQLINSIREFLVNRRYLIVIDDIWENTYWKERMELALLENNCGSRIIITTRNFEVATKIADELYRMKPLSNDYSRKLFYTRIFGAHDKIPDNELDEISNKFLKKCDGVPLAIITMASLLAGKPRDKWSDMFTSVGFGHKDDEHVDNTMKILYFSYYDMPAHLRTCLLYLSVFPEDYKIDKEPLIHMWIAEGFIQGKKGIWLYDLGEQYFNDLVNRSMIQPVDNDSGSTVEYCYVHDMVLDLIRSISYQENFVTVIDGDEAPPSCARRIAFDKNTMDCTAHGNMMDMTQVRSLITIGCDAGYQVPLSSFKLLRVLEIQDCSSLRVSNLVHLKNLPHLRYLGLRNTQVEDIPNEIGALKLLQTLNLMNTGITYLTPRISQLTQMVCLRVDSFLMVEPDWIGKLKSLEDLELPITGSSNFFKALGSLRELKVLKIDFWTEMTNSEQKDFVLSLRNLHKLVHLLIRCNHHISHANTSIWGESGFVLPRHLQSLIIYDIVFLCLPSCISAACLPNLTDLSLNVDAMEQKDLEFLGRLPELCYLCLYTHTVTQIDINTSVGYFQKLRFCYLPWSMIQFLCKEGDSSVSFHISDRTSAMRFGYSKNYFSIPRCVVMPNLEMLCFQIYLQALIDGKGTCGNIGLEYLPSLQKVNVYINRMGASVAEVDEAEAGLRKATELHPNHPTLVINTDDMISAVQDQKLGDAEEEGQKQEEPSADEGVIESSIDSV